MAIKLNESAIAHAKRLIKAGEFERGDWNWEEHKPTRDEISKFLNAHYTEEYGEWFLGVDTEIDKKNKDRYSFPLGDLKIVHKDALVYSAENAAEKGLDEIEDAAVELMKLIDEQH